MANPQSALDQAFQRDNLTLLYQPIHDAVSGAIVAAEALLRQRRENGDIREAGIITEAAENASSSDLYALDSRTMQMAVSGAAQWSSRHHAVRLNVNLSPREFESGSVVDRLMPFLAGCDVSADMLALEITESSHIDDPAATVRTLVELKSRGIRLWLDDFGTGHSTLTHLHRFPIDGIKLAADFVKDLESNARSRSILRALIGLAHDMQVKVIAEGVERESQRAFLLEHGCDMIQGFLFSRPMPLDAFVAALNAHVAVSS